MANERNEQLISATDERNLAVGDELCAAGDRLDAVYQVRTGLLGVIVDGDDGELRIGELGTAAFVGEITALTGGAATATIRAEEPTVLSVIPFPDYAAWLAEHPDAAEQVAATARDRSNRSRTAALVAELTGISDGAAIDKIIDLMTWEVVQADELVFRRGDTADAAYIVVNGRVKVVIEETEDHLAAEIELGRGALIGELGIIEDAPRNATVMAVRDTTLARISRDRFEMLAASHPAALVRIVRTILLEARDGVAPLGRCRSVAVAVTDPRGYRPDFLETYVTEVERFGGIVRFSAELIESVLGRSGAALATAGTLEQQRLTELLHEAETGADYLLFEVSDDLDAWSTRALRYTDRLLIMTSATPDRRERARIEQLVAAADAIPGILVWIVRDYEEGSKPFGAAEILVDDRIHDVVHIRGGRTADVQRLARLSTGNGYGVVFGGGGARGFAHIGVIQAFAELGVPVDLVSGASIGAVLAGGQAIDLAPEDQPAVAQRLFHKLMDYTIPIVSLIRARKGTANIEEMFGEWRIEDCWLPMSCVSTNLTASRVEVHRSGSMSEAIRASVSLPGVLPPVTRDGQMLVDGGVLDNIPVDLVADDDRVGTVIALDTSSGEDDYYGLTDFPPTVSGFRALFALANPRKEKYPSLFSTVIRSLLVAASGRREEVLASGKIDLYLAYDLPGVGLLDFETLASTAAAGYEAAKPRIEAWLAETKNRSA
ncbi:MAG: cyclic nucleotide-binding domain-containing protein [Actinomycetota bacterium]